MAGIESQICFRLQVTIGTCLEMLKRTSNFDGISVHAWDITTSSFENTKCRHFGILLFRFHFDLFIVMSMTFLFGSAY